MATNAVTPEPPPSSWHRCMQNIALLFLLKGCVASQADDDDPVFRINDPADHQKTLIDVLAFLSCVDTDPNHVTAVTVEPCADSTPATRVIVAINKARLADNDTVLQNIVDSFWRIFKIMSRCSPGGHDKVQIRNELLLEIASLCRRKIVDCIRPPGYRPPPSPFQKARPYIGSKLQDVVGIFESRRAKKDKTVKAFSQETATLLAKLEPLALAFSTGAQVSDTLLSSVIYAFYLFNRGTKISAVVGYLDNRDMNPSLQGSLARRVQLLACYARCANYLTRLALDAANSRASSAVPWIQNTHVMAVPLTNDDFVNLAAGSSKQSLSTCLGRFGRTPDTLNSYVERHYPTLSTTPDIEFDTAYWKVLGGSDEPRIHAEIQIACYLDCLNRDRRNSSPSSNSTNRASQNTPPAPYIASSKDACYLCHAFLSAHGGFHIPSTHGTVYPGWRLPHMAATFASANSATTFDEPLARFNRALEIRIEVALAIATSGKRAISKASNAIEGRLPSVPRSTVSLAVSSATVRPSDRNSGRSSVNTVDEAAEEEDEDENEDENEDPSTPVQSSLALTPPAEVSPVWTAAANDTTRLQTLQTSASSQEALTPSRRGSPRPTMPSVALCLRNNSNNSIYSSENGDVVAGEEGEEGEGDGEGDDDGEGDSHVSVTVVTFAASSGQRKSSALPLPVPRLLPSPPASPPVSQASLAPPLSLTSPAPPASQWNYQRKRGSYFSSASGQSSDTAPGETRRRYATKRLEVFIEFEADGQDSQYSTSSGTAAPTQGLLVERLTGDEAHLVRQRSRQRDLALTLVDFDAVDASLEVVTRAGQDGCIYVSGGGDIFRMTPK